MARAHLQHLGILLPGGLVAERLVVIDANRVFRIEPDHPAVLDVHAWDAVSGRGHDEGIIEADFPRAGADLGVPVYLALAQPEMPFSDGGGAIAAVPKNRRESSAAGLNDEVRVA